MGELLAVRCEVCGEPMLPNVSTLDDDGCGWICVNPCCKECSAEEAEFLDLIEAGIPEYLAVQLSRLLEFYEEQRTAHWGTGRASSVGKRRADSCESPSTELPWLRTTDGRAVELGRQRRLLALLGARLRVARAMCRDAGELAAALDRDLVVSFMSSEFDVGQDAKQSLAVLAQLCATIGKSLDDARACYDEIDDGLVGLRTGEEF